MCVMRVLTVLNLKLALRVAVVTGLTSIRLLGKRSLESTQQEYPHHFPVLVPTPLCAGQ